MNKQIADLPNEQAQYATGAGPGGDVATLERGNTDIHGVDPWGVALAIIAAVGFSAKAIFVKLSYAEAEVAAITLVLWRLIFSLPVFAWVGWRTSRRGSHLTRREWALVALFGMLGYYGSSILDFIGLRYISAGLERLILFTYPAMTLVLTAMFFGQRLTRYKLISLLLCSLGIALAFAHDLKATDNTNSMWIGAGFVFASALCYAIFLSGSGPIISRLGAMRFTALMMLVSTLATCAHFFATEPLSALKLPPLVYVYCLGMTLLSTVLPIFAQSEAIHRLGASRVSLFSMIGPMLTILLGWWILHEPISAWQMAGVVFVVAGVALAMRGRGK